MRTVTITIQGKKYELPAFASAGEALAKAGLIKPGLQKYEDNPVIGVLINGELKPIGAPVSMSCEIQPILTYQGFGRRIYRHSICFLLCYASHLVFPGRRLKIGHSLGDGFFFNYEDGRGTDDEQIGQLAAKMKELVDKELDINYVSLSGQDAIAKLRKQGFDDAVLLLQSVNMPSVNMYNIRDYYHVAYEPIADNTSKLGIWDLRRYGDSGMLLRYPVRDSINEVVPFKDNNRLFDVFNEYRAWGKILGIECVGEMNKACSDMSVEQYVRLSEALQRRKIASFADDIHNRRARAVFIAGPSSSGKTTFAKKLCEQLLLREYSPIRISLDNYYKKREFVPLDEEGKKDFEALEALNIDLFDQNMQDLFDGKEVDLPEFSFTDNETYYRNKPIRMNDNTIFVIEGIHGLNPRITSKIPP